MQPIHTFNVVPKLPAQLEPLRELVFNLWWTWEPQARGLFRHLDPALWHRTNHNPLRMLQLCRQARLTEVAEVTGSHGATEQRRVVLKYSVSPLLRVDPLPPQSPFSLSST